MRVLVCIVVIIFIAVAGVYAGPLAKIYVVPSNVGLVAGAQQQFQAIGEDADGNEVPIPMPIWGCDPQAGSITATGLFTAGNNVKQHPNSVILMASGLLVYRASVEVYAHENRGGYSIERSVGSIKGGGVTCPSDVTQSRNGYFYVLSEGRLILKLDSVGRLVSLFALSDTVAESAKIAVDGSGNVYVLDPVASRIWKYNSSGSFVTQWGSEGTEPGQFKGARDIAVDSNGLVYVADSWNFRMQMFDPNGAFVRQWQTQLYYQPDNYYQKWVPTSVSIDGSDRVWVEVMESPDLDGYGPEIQQYDTQGQLISRDHVPDMLGGEIGVADNGIIYELLGDNIRIYEKQLVNGSIVYVKVGQWGGVGSVTGKFWSARGICVDAGGKVYVADYRNDRVQVFAANGQYMHTWSSAGSLKGQFKYPSALTLDSQGNLYVADTGNHRVQQFDSNGTFIRELASKRQKDSSFACPSGVTIGPSDKLYVADAGFSRVLGYTDAALSSNWMLQYGALGILGAGSITYNPTGHLYVTHPDRNMMSKWNTTGQNYGIWLDGLNTPAGICPGPQNYNYLANYGTNRIRKYNSGTLLGEWGSTGSGDGQLQGPAGVRVDSQGFVYVADSGNHRIQKFDSNGAFISKLGSKGYEAFQFLYPEDLALGGQGSIYVADTQNHRVCKFVPFVAQNLREAKQSKDGTPASISGAVVTAAFSSFFYIENDDRTTGIRVNKTNHGATVGMRVNVTGTVSTFGYERCIEATDVVQVGSGSIKPVAMKNAAIGGGDWQYDPIEGTGQCGFDGGTGLNNIGLLVSTSGRVTYMGSTYIYIDDGSRLLHTPLARGIKVITPSYIPVADGYYIRVTGVCSAENDSMGFYPVIRIRSESDIVVDQFDGPLPPGE